MDLGKMKIFFFSLMAVFGFCLGSVYKVGDSAGWTIIGNVDYDTWASSKTFQIGDVLIFNYDAQFHNVLQVTLPGFHSCNSSSPIATYSTGNDSITVTSPGHYYYICGFVGHCEAGQKVDIRVPKSPQPTAIPIAAPPGHLAVPETAPSGLITPSPSKNSAESLLPPFKFCSKIVLCLLVFGLYDFILVLGRNCVEYQVKWCPIFGVILKLVVCEFSMAMGGIVYKVGDAAGWTNIANVDYKSWAADKNFHVGDTILFDYNKQFQNVKVNIRVDGSPNPAVAPAPSPSATHGRAVPPSHTTSSPSVQPTSPPSSVSPSPVLGHAPSSHKSGGASLYSPWKLWAPAVILSFGLSAIAF
ncbi:Phytocyanin domain-containing protein [Abeliophyllum distichum]|uniref:Phytocyanin domain-containing protein n=1 Tax=Abeliophyllum distichum TaxID=126358 RepID=A0ABD1RF86_9LAMI